MSLHADAVKVLTAYQPTDEHQQSLRASFLTFLGANAGAMTRECRPAHLTGSAIIVDATGERVLLTFHSKAHMWLQMGGHCEPGDQALADVALREAREESGIATLTLLPDPVLLDRHPAPCSPYVEHHLDVMYVAIAPADAVEQISPESIRLGWFTPDEIPEPTDDAVRRLARAGTARVRAELAGR
ncbi:NUDIX hydrolase [Sporichthya brevicatena]|uniref:NUDIX hydrolase n=1 Tax=Sporichthya brevicatena TaxID=171442 RepID=A0ABN1H326_9ACTN